MSYFGVSLRNGVGLGLGTVPSLTNTPLSYRLAPSLDLSFAGSDALSPAITFSRATNATVTGSNGLIQNAPMNLLTFSEQFDNAAWTKANATITANSTVAPNGTTTADTATATAANGVVQNTPMSITVVVDTTYTSSVYVKRRTGTGVVQLSRLDGTYVTLSVTDEWQRFTVTSTAANTTGRFFIRLVTSGDAVDIWGAQLEVGSTATTYNPTTVKNLLGFTENFDNAAWTKSNAFVQTNLLTYSQDFDNAAWTKTGLTIGANTAAAPDGTATADKFAEDSSTGTHSVVPSSVSKSAAATQFTFSIYAKAAERSALQMRIADAASSANRVICDANLSAQTVSTSSGGTFSSPSATITDVGSGWYRITLTGTTSTETSIFALVFLANPAGTISYTGVTGSGLLIWGAQLVQGTSAGDYKATYAAAAAVGYTDIYGQPFAQKLVETAATGVHSVGTGSTTIVGTLYTFNAYVKAAERSWCVVQLQAACFAYVNLTTGAVGTTSGSPTVAVASVGNGWYRVSVTASATGTSSSTTVYAATGDGTVSYTGDGTSGIYIFGAQLSDSASVDPYVYQPVAAPTSTAYYGPRFDYDPVTLAPKGLLIEEQRTNLLVRSEEFADASWIKDRTTVTANSAVAPNGATTADTLRADAGTAITPYITQGGVTGTAGIPYTMSMYLKEGTHRFVQIRANAGGVWFANFDVSLGVVGTFSGCTPSIVAVGNGWYRCVLTGTPAGTAPTSALILVPSASSANFPAWNPAGTETVFIWGAQLEAGAFATSYIPTVASQVTRAADSASMIGNNFARWFTSPNAYSVFSDYIYAGDLSGVVFTIDVGQVAASANDYSTLPFTSNLGTIQPSVKSGGVVQATNTFSTLVTGASAKTAYAVTTNNFIAANNGTLGTIDTSVVMPSLPNSINFGLSYNFGQGTFWLKRFASYSRVLSSVELQGITS